MNLDLTSLKKALSSLQEVLNELNKDKTNEFVKDAAVRRFEYTFELSYKMLRRFLEMSETDRQEIKAMSFADIIRTASTKDLLLNDLEKWAVYREKRNITSHIYDEKKAEEVISIIPDFFKEAEFLLNKLTDKAKSL
jgi:nucleotidyltransferase substrate binding protein (TIGR01987 family)